MARPFESKIQDIVYNVDVGVGLRLVKATLYVLFVLVVMVIYTATQFHGLRDAEAMDYAQLARNYLQQGKLVTQYIRPASMWYLIEHTERKNPLIKDHPDIVHPPVYPMALAAGFGLMKSSLSAERTSQIFPPEQWVIIPFNHVCTLLTGLFLYLLARRLFDPNLALLGVTLFFLSDAVWDISISGLGISLAALWVVLAWYAAVLAVSHREQTDRPVWHWLVPFALSIVFTALAFLTRYGTAVMVPALALYYGWSLRERGGALAAVVVAGFLVLISPWLIRNYTVSGGVLGLAAHLTLNGPDPVLDNEFERTLAPTLEFSGVLHDLQIKWLEGLATLYRGGLRTLGDGVLTCMFLTAFFYRFSRDPVNRLRWCIGLALLLLVLLAPLFGQATERLLYIFWPFALLYGLAFFFILVDRLQLRLPILRMSVLGLLIFLTTLPLALRILPPREGAPYPPYFPPYISHVSRMLMPDELLCADMPWATAWYGDRTSLLLPLTVDDFYTINDYTKRISGLYFTTITRDREYVRALLTGSYRTWFPIMEGRIPGDFPLTQGFPLSNMDQLFLTDRPRWQE